MNRFKKLVINICVITSLLGLFYYFSGYYISKNKCIEDMLEFFNSDDTRIIKEITKDNITRVILTDRDNESISVIKLEKYGFLYKTGSSSLNQPIDKKNSFVIYTYFDTSFEHSIIIYRNNKDIDNIKITFRDNREISHNEWIGDFMYISDWTEKLGSHNFGLYEAFDKEGNLIEQIEY